MSNKHFIVIFEPDRRISDVLRVELSQTTPTVLPATSLEEAEDLVRKFKVSLIILDASHEKYGTYRACTCIRHLPGYATTPIILTSGSVGPIDTVAAATAGASGLLEKPYSFNDLVLTIRGQIAANDPLRDSLPTPSNTGIVWPDIRRWRFTAWSGLHPPNRVMPVVLDVTTRLPLYRAS